MRLRIRMLGVRRAAAAVGVVALGAGATVALGVAPAGAASPGAPGAAATVPVTLGINGLCGSVVAAPIPPNLGQGHSESNSLRIFREKFDFHLTGSVPVDFVKPGLYSEPTDLPSPKPSIPTGTEVNSYILHSDPPGKNPLLREHVAATVGFTTDVIGVQVLSATITEGQNTQLQVSTTHYPGTTSGLELSPSGTGDFARVVNSHTVAISFKTSSAVDEIRVITKATSSTATALNGYRILAADGGVFDFGGQQFYGSTGGRVLNQPIVSGVNTCGNAGYWFVARDGGVFSYGDAAFHGSLGGTVLNSPVVGMAATDTGDGYYLVRANGTVNVFGDAHFFRDASGLHLNQPIVGMTPTATGLGYYLVASDGGIFEYGDGGFYGSTGNLHLVSPIIGMTLTRTGRGYYLYAADGGIFAFGDAVFHGSVGGAVRANPIVGMRLSPSGNGYWLTDSAGKVYAFGDAVFAGDMSNVHLFRPMIGMM